jgi:2-keto-4-pentenoate hydratase
VSLSVNGEEVVTGEREQVMGHPMHSLAWLVNALPRFHAFVRAGQIITSGTMTGIFADIKAGDAISASFDGYGVVSATLKAL